MWSYYGNKSKIVHLYPPPKHQVIIEPFAGTARYSLYNTNWKRDVILYDKFKKIIDVWKFLQQASEKDILGLPKIKQRENLDDFEQLSEVEKMLIGWCIQGGIAAPAKTASSFNAWGRLQEKIAKNLHKIK